MFNKKKGKEKRKKRGGECTTMRTWVRENQSRLFPNFRVSLHGLSCHTFAHIILAVFSLHVLNLIIFIKKI